MATTRPRMMRERPISMVVYTRHSSTACASAGREPSRFHLAHLGREVGCTDVHLFGDVLSDHVDHKAAGAPDVAGCVFGNKRLPRPIGYAYSDDGRVGVQVVVCTEGCRIQLPILIHAGD